MVGVELVDSGGDVGKERVGTREDGMGGGQGDGESLHLINDSMTKLIGSLHYSPVFLKGC